MSGVGFDFQETALDLRDVAVTKNKFTCTYCQNGYVYRVEVVSKDGIVYRGHWGYPSLRADYAVELKRFESNDKEIVLIGQWTNAEDHQIGAWLFRLQP